MGKARKRLRWALLILFLLLVAALAAASVGLYRAQRQRPDRAFGTVTWVANARGEWFKGSPWVRDRLRDYISHLFETDSPWPVTLALTDETKPDYVVVALGDSQTGGRMLDEKQRWTYFLERLLAYHLPDRTVRVVNAGIPGNTIRQIAHRVGRDALSFDPNVIILGVGFNDARILVESEGELHVLVPLDRFERLLDEIVGGIRQHSNASVILWPPAPMGSGYRSNLGPKYTSGQRELLARYVPVAQSIAEKHGCGFADVFAYLDTHPLGDHAHLKDGVHLNALGNLLAVKPIFEAWCAIENVEPLDRFIALIPKAIGKIDFDTQRIKLPQNLKKNLQKSRQEKAATENKSSP